jgi:signal transduction histidine kinase
MVDQRGTRIWVSHRVKVRVGNGFRNFCGCIVPLASNELSTLLEPSAISSFVHKLGNHFQLLNFALNSLRKGATETQETDVVQETLDKAIALTRAFSEFSQAPAWVSAFEFLDTVDAAIVSRSAAFIDYRIEIERDFDPGLSGTTISGDPYLIELAIAAILQNAIEASADRRNIRVRASVEMRDGVRVAVRLVVADGGVGIKECNLSKVMLPFFSTKSNHDGLGLSMAARFIELHRGNLTIDSEVGKGTEVQILLPLNRDADDACR